MAIYLKLNPAQYQNGSINLYRGDDWKIYGKIVNDLPGNYFGDVDLAGISATAYFPADPSQPVSQIPAVVQVTNVKTGDVTITMPASGSPLTGLTPNGSNMLIQTVNAASAVTTYSTNDSPLNIQDKLTLQF